MLAHELALFVTTVAISTSRAPVGASISVVVPDALPRQVLQPIVFLVIVVMTALEALWARPYEGFQDQTMKPVLFSSTALRQSHYAVSRVVLADLALFSASAEVP